MFGFSSYLLNKKHTPNSFRNLKAHVRIQLFCAFRFLYLTSLLSPTTFHLMVFSFLFFHKLWLTRFSLPLIGEFFYKTCVPYCVQYLHMNFVYFFICLLYSSLFFHKFLYKTRNKQQMFHVFLGLIQIPFFKNNVQIPSNCELV